MESVLAYIERPDLTPAAEVNLEWLAGRGMGLEVKGKPDKAMTIKDQRTIYTWHSGCENIKR